MSENKLVPIVPTPEMCEAGQNAQPFAEHDAAIVYAAMIAATPTVQPNEWMDIETAPDGVDVLLWDGSKMFVDRKRLKVSHQFAPVEKITNWYSWDGVIATHWAHLLTPPAPNQKGDV